MKYLNAFISIICTVLFATLVFYIANIIIQNSDFDPVRKHGFDNSVIDTFGVMSFHYVVIGLCFFVVMFWAKLKILSVQIIIAILIGFLSLNLLRAFTWGISFRDTLGNVELALISFSSIGLPISYYLLSRKKNWTT